MGGVGAGGRIDVEAHDEIVAAVGEVGETAVAGEDGVAAGVGDFAVLGGGARSQQIYGLDGGETAVGAFPLEHCDGGVELVDAVGDFAVGMEVQGARAVAGLGLIRARGSELAGGAVEFVDVDLVAAEIVDVGEAVVGRERGEVGVGHLLAVRDRALAGGIAGVVLGPDGFAKLAVFGQEAGGAASGVVGADDDAAGVVGGEVTGASAVGGDERDGGESASRRSEAADGAGGLALELIDFRGDVEVAAVGRIVEPGGVADFGGDALRRERAGLFVPGEGEEAVLGAVADQDAAGILTRSGRYERCEGSGIRLRRRR